MTTTKGDHGSAFYISFPFKWDKIILHGLVFTSVFFDNATGGCQNLKILFLFMALKLH